MPQPAPTEHSQVILSNCDDLRIVTVEELTRGGIVNKGGGRREAHYMGIREAKMSLYKFGAFQEVKFKNFLQP